MGTVEVAIAHSTSVTQLMTHPLLHLAAFFHPEWQRRP